MIVVHSSNARVNEAAEFYGEDGMVYEKCVGTSQDKRFAKSMSMLR